ncbi:MAG: undecaprenyl-diphosphate phosphatase, partial [Verrucomicrobiota bacterium]|nr:undecaprenyl-diphosphate phosphatase [Verrucomicrobiota bacterium]
GAYKVLKAVRAGSVTEEWGQLALATVVSAVTAFVSVRWLLRYIETHTFVVFGWYRIALGLALLAMVAW